MPRDLKDPEGCNVSSLRKILLLRFRHRVHAKEGRRKGGGGVVVPSRCFGEVGRFDQRRLSPRRGFLDSHDDGRVGRSGYGVRGLKCRQGGKK